MTNRAKPTPQFPCLVCLLAAVSASCDRSPTPPPAAPEPIHVLAAVYPLADVVRRVGGQWVSVDWVIEGANDPRDIQLTDPLREKTNWANFIIGSGFEDSWARQDLTEFTRRTRLILPDTTAAGRADALSAAGESALWMDPQVMRETCLLISDRLRVRDAPHELDYRANAAAYDGELARLIAEHTPKTASLPHKKFLALRPTWSSMAHRFGLEEIHPINAEPQNVTDAQARDLRDAAKANDVHLLVLNSTPPPAVMHDLEDRTHLKVVPLDLLGTSATGGHRTYAELLRYDLDQLERALK